MQAPRKNSADLRAEQKKNISILPKTRQGQFAIKRAASIAALNDQLRRQGRGGSVVMTRGISNLAPEILERIIVGVRDFDAFTRDNDPYGERDCAVVEVDGLSIIWKIDAYDRSIHVASPDPTDPRVTHRVLTVMLADEY